MKTPIQKLIEHWEQEKGSYIPNGPLFDIFINDAKKLLEEERQVIIDAFEDGYNSFEQMGEKPASVEYFYLNFEETDIRKLRPS